MLAEPVIRQLRERQIERLAVREHVRGALIERSDHDEVRRTALVDQRHDRGPVEPAKLAERAVLLDEALQAFACGLVARRRRGRARRCRPRAPTAPRRPDRDPSRSPARRSRTRASQARRLGRRMPAREAAATVISMRRVRPLRAERRRPPRPARQSALAPGAASCCPGVCHRFVVASTNAVSPSATAAAGHQRQLVLRCPEHLGRRAHDEPSVDERAHRACRRRAARGPRRR